MSCSFVQELTSSSSDSYLQMVCSYHGVAHLWEEHIVRSGNHAFDEKLVAYVLSVQHCLYDIRFRPGVRYIFLSSRHYRDESFVHAHNDHDCSFHVSARVDHYFGDNFHDACCCGNSADDVVDGFFHNHCFVRPPRVYY